MLDSELWLPLNLLYDSNSYLWIRYDTEMHVCTVGASSPALESLGEIAYLSFTNTSGLFQRGDVVGSMEAAKMTSEIVTPVSGRIVSVNDEVIGNPRLVNDEPYKSGWLFMVAPTQWATENSLMVDSEGLQRNLPEDLRGPTRE